MCPACFSSLASAAMVVVGLTSASGVAALVIKLRANIGSDTAAIIHHGEEQHGVKVGHIR